MELKKIMAIAVVSALFISISGTMLGPWVISAVYGPGYALAGKLFPVFMASTVFMLPNFILTQTMVALNLEKFYACVAFATAVFNIGLNMVVIPEYSAFGAAWATVATEFLLTCLSVFGIFSRRKHEP